MNALHKYRKDKELTQEEFAKILGITKATVSRYEKGTRKVAIERLAEVSRLTGISRQRLRPDIFKASPQPEQAI